MADITAADQKIARLEQLMDALLAHNPALSQGFGQLDAKLVQELRADLQHTDEPSE